MDENTVKVIIAKNPNNGKLSIHPLEELVSDKDQLILTKRVIDAYVPLFWKLRNVKADLKFCGYLEFALSAVLREVESTLICAFYLLLFLFMFMIGIQHQTMEVEDCRANPMLAMYLIESGVLGCVVNAINLTYFVCGRNNMTLRNLKNLFHGFLFLSNVIGLYHVYSIYNPNVVDRNSAYYCQFNLYWIAFFAIHFTAALYTVVIVLLLISLVYYFM